MLLCQYCKIFLTSDLGTEYLATFDKIKGFMLLRVEGRGGEAEVFVSSASMFFTCGLLYLFMYFFLSLNRFLSQSSLKNLFLTFTDSQVSL